MQSLRKEIQKIKQEMALLEKNPNFDHSRTLSDACAVITTAQADVSSTVSDVTLSDEANIPIANTTDAPALVADSSNDDISDAFGMFDETAVTQVGLAVKCDGKGAMVYLINKSKYSSISLKF